VQDGLFPKKNKICCTIIKETRVLIKTKQLSVKLSQFSFFKITLLHNLLHNHEFRLMILILLHVTECFMYFRYIYQLFLLQIVIFICYNKTISKSSHWIFVFPTTNVNFISYMHCFFFKIKFHVFLFHSLSQFPGTALHSMGSMGSAEPMDFKKRL